MNSAKLNTVILVSVILLITGLFSIFTELRREKVCTDLAVATIVRIDRKSSRTDTKYRLVIKYTYNDKEYSKKGKYITQKPPYKANDIIPIKVNPKNPSEYYTDYEITLLRNLIFSAVGIVGTISAVIAKIIENKKRHDYY
ncbi:MAG: DUF3592 domain-containing protein [Ruminococcus sp.]|nr:DUF3592 domain-containing protein [Ruminococcus sp.]MDE6784345.1 DUF3592 domain-containing protein [Ruminococcus sp.]